ncbi:unnamed protein product [Linum trigynum]|uniref:Uncharacterized protein n=1 Tax=Linum trigynum TaxID=586398 RepID=A0AAV2D438_9ROSI
MVTDLPRINLVPRPPSFLPQLPIRNSPSLLCIATVPPSSSRFANGYGESISSLCLHLFFPGHRSGFRRSRDQSDAATRASPAPPSPSPIRAPARLLRHLLPDQLPNSPPATQSPAGRYCSSATSISPRRFPPPPATVPRRISSATSPRAITSNHRLCCAVSSVNRATNR